MSANVLFISAKILKDKSVLTDNIEEKFLNPIIKKAQDKCLEPVLGTDLFRDLQVKIAAGTLSAEEKALIDGYIIDVLVYGCLVHGMVELNFKLQNIGVQTKAENNAPATAYKEIAYLVEYYRNDLEEYTTKLISYLRAHTAEFPLYLANAECDKLKPKTEGYSCPIFLG